jgi:hypothetical protein
LAVGGVGAWGDLAEGVPGLGVEEGLEGCAESEEGGERGVVGLGEGALGLLEGEGAAGVGDGGLGRESLGFEVDGERLEGLGGVGGGNRGGGGVEGEGSDGPEVGGHALHQGLDPGGGDEEEAARASAAQHLAVFVPALGVIDPGAAPLGGLVGHRGAPEEGVGGGGEDAGQELAQVLGLVEGELDEVKRGVLLDASDAVEDDVGRVAVVGEEKDDPKLVGKINGVGEELPFSLGGVGERSLGEISLTHFVCAGGIARLGRGYVRG